MYKVQCTKYKVQSIEYRVLYLPNTERELAIVAALRPCLAVGRATDILHVLSSRTSVEARLCHSPASR